MKTPEEKYRNDPKYHQLVDIFYHFIEKADFTPSEIREASVYACILHESLNVRKMVYPRTAELEQAFREFDRFSRREG